MHFGRDAVIVGGAAGLAEHEHKKHHRRAGVVETRTTKPTFMTRLRGRNAKSQTVKTTTTIEPDSRAGVHGHSGGGIMGTSAATSTRRNGRWGGRRGAGTTGGVRRQRRPGLGDKISGAMMKLKGSLMNRPREKAAGDRRMNGRRTHTVY
ncbi:hypothetical protein B7463_g12507, partial [Scytalidium lignicola]